MRLTRLALTDFRNFARADVAFAPDAGAVLLLGNNAQGKTNFLEAIYTLAALKSFRGASRANLIRHGAAAALAEGAIQKAGVSHRLAIRWTHEDREQSTDAMRVAPGEFVAIASAVAFVPGDLTLPHAGPGERRRALDRAIFAQHPVYLDELRRFQHALKARNALLRDVAPPDPGVLDAWDAEFSRLAAVVTLRRARWVEQLAGRIAAAYARMSGVADPVGVGYAPGCGDFSELGALAGVTPDVLAELIGARLRANRRREIERTRGTGPGPHRDDLLCILEGMPLAAVGSQGQQRGFILALKAVELEAAYEARNEWPLLLLDDVVSELDPERRARLLEFVGASAAQVFITTTDVALLGPLSTAGTALFRVDAGTILPE